MANTNNNNFNQITDNLINFLKESNKNLEKLIDERHRLNESFLNETSKEIINNLTIDTEQFEKNLIRKLKELKIDEKYKNLSFEPSIEGFEKFVKETIVLQKQLDELTDKKINLEIKKNQGNATKKELEDLEKIIIEHEQINDKIKERTEFQNELKDESTKYYNCVNKLQAELNKRQLEGITILDDYNEKWEQRTRALKKGTKEIVDGAKGIYTAIKDTLKPWSQANDEVMKYARSMGMSQKTADQFLSKTVSWASKNDIGLLFNKTTDELIKMQGKYSEVLGRNVQLTDEQKKDMLAMETFLGEDGMMDIANNLENLGMGMSDSAEFVKEQLDSATKSGIVASKLTKTIRENIKMAQNYTFKNGLDGLASMAKKAIQLKTDMSLVDSLANNVSTVEGAITTGAKLQVLGGSYAMGADPLSMMYESLNDMEGLYDRAVGMAKSKVFYNNETGNFEMGAMDRYMMKQAATAMGMDPSKLIDVAYRQASLDKIEGQINTNSNISGDKDMVELVKNLATWNNGKAVVNIDGKDIEVGKLESTDKEKLQAMQRTDSQNLQEMAMTLRSMHDVMTGVEKETNNEQANIVKGIGEKITNFMKNNSKLLDTVSKIFAWKGFLGGIQGTLIGMWTTVHGIYRSINGVGNLFSTTPRNIAGTANGVTRGIKLNQVGGVFKKGGLRSTETVYNYNGHNYTLNSNGKFVNSAGRELSETYSNRITRHGTQVSQKGTWTNLAKSAGKGMKMGAGIGAFAAASSIGIDIATGEFQKDMGRSIGKATGPLVGSIIGGVFGPIGSLVGGFLGDAITSGIQKEQDRRRGELRDKIASEYAAANNMVVANLFKGENALQGNYSKKQLKKLNAALEDGRLTESDNLSNGILRKARNNGDLIRMRESGIQISTEFANGGIIRGISHAQGGMPILGSNIEVEGGEYVVNKKATRENLPLLEKINNGNYKFTAKEPLGKQMKVSEGIFGNNNSYNSPKIDINPISINLSGTIKLDAGSKQFDISKEILNNPQLITRLTEMINKQINILEYGSYNKDRIKQKFI